VTASFMGSGAKMTWVKRDKTQTLVPLKVEWSGGQLRAKELLNRFLATDLTGREFLRQADKLSDGELGLLRHLLIQRSIRKQKDDTIVNGRHSRRPWLWRCP
jgi:hypothetical protein